MDYEITAQECAARLGLEASAAEKPVLLDVRESWEYETARVDGSRHIPMGEIPARANLELDPDAHIVVMCHHGVRSMNVTVWLRNQGFDRVQSLAGGIDAWSCTIDRSIPRY